MKRVLISFAISIVCVACIAQSASDKEEFEYNRRLAQTSKSFVPSEGFVPDRDTAIAIARAVAVPIYGKKQLDGEHPLRADLKDGKWTVLGTLHCSNCEGGTLVIQIDKQSGKILFLTHTK